MLANSAYPYTLPRKRSGLGTLIKLGIVLLILYYAYPFVGNLEIDLGTPEREGDGYGFTLQPNDPLFDDQYALQKVNAAAAWSITTGKSSIVVAVVDTGVDASHPDLKGKLVKGYDFVSNDSTPEDTLGHGTFVASLIAANQNNASGIAGLAPGVKIMPLKVLGGKNGTGNSQNIARAIRYATDNGAKVINLSLGSPYPSASTRQAIEYAVARKVVVVAASGNEAMQGNPVGYPAAFTNVISVGATGSRNTIASFSTHNKAVDVVAPGVNVLGARSSKNTMCRAYEQSAYCMSSGTSFAAPYVAATVALMLSVNADLSPEQIRSILVKTSTDLGQRGQDNYYGAGLINAGKAVATAQKG